MALESHHQGHVKVETRIALDGVDSNAKMRQCAGSKRSNNRWRTATALVQLAHGVCHEVESCELFNQNKTIVSVSYLQPPRNRFPCFGKKQAHAAFEPTMLSQSFLVDSFIYIVLMFGS